jgi:methionyl-tRNA synthetase
MASTYLTVAIPYVNAAPHLGYAYELILADIAARARRAQPASPVRFLGGTDDYSLKNVLAAEAAGIPTAEFVTAHAERFAQLTGPLSISFDDFIRTSADPRHAPAVTRLWERVAASGDLYRKAYNGQYCVGCEQFYSPVELVEGRCPEHRTPTETVEEENWFFRLSAYQDHLVQAITSGELTITPNAYRSEALAFIQAGLDDISVSRSARRARRWGIPVPGDAEQVIYVWFDALTNYLSALDYAIPDSPAYQQWWTGADERIHVIGKGILRFHAIYWPAFLASAGEPAPTRIHVHPYLSLDGAKLSKSSGVTVDPVTLTDTYGVDALRWWFARDVQSTSDTDFTIERVIDRANEDLAGGFANALNRITTLIHRYRHGVIPNVDTPPISAVDGLIGTVNRALGDLDLRRGSQLLLDAVGALNRDLETDAPWTLAKDPNRQQELDVALARYVNSVVEIANALTPILPDLSERLHRQLASPQGHLPPPVQTYPRIQPPSSPGRSSPIHPTKGS